MFLPETHAHHDADDGDAGEEDDERVDAVTYPADAEEDVADHQVEEGPKNVGGGRGEPFAGRVREGRGKGIAGDAVHEVGHGVGEKHPGEEAGDVVVPDHGGFCSIAGVSCRDGPYRGGSYPGARDRAARGRRFQACCGRGGRCCSLRSSGRARRRDRGSGTCTSR